MPGVPIPASINTNIDSKPDDDFLVGSPSKKHRASMAGFDDVSIQQRLGGAMTSTGPIGELLGGVGTSMSPSGPSGSSHQFGGELVKKPDVDEEL